MNNYLQKNIVLGNSTPGNSHGRYSLAAAIGNTPLLKLGKVYAKMEGLNPSGSIKDRVALEIIEGAERRGELKKGDTIVEASSGNTGISLAMVGAIKGYKVVIVMPENMSMERRLIMKSLGAELVLTSKSGSLKEAIEKAEEIATRPNVFQARQFSNPDNLKAQEITGEEIIREIGACDAVVAGVGTGGTLMGISRAMKRVNPDVKVISVEPEEAAVMFGGSDARIREHKIQGIGDGFIPKLIDMDEVDGVFTVNSQEAIAMTKQLFREYGVLAGISSGANMLVAQRVARKYDKVVTVLPDRAERYLSMNLFA
jgi:cysteine synthase A